MELYARVRRAVQVEGKSERAVAREYGLARETVRKMMQYSAPPGYRRQQPAKRPKLDPWVGVIDAILEEDRERPRKPNRLFQHIPVQIAASQNTQQICPLQSVVVPGHSVNRTAVKRHETFLGLKCSDAPKEGLSEQVILRQARSRRQEENHPVFVVVVYFQTRKRVGAAGPRRQPRTSDEMVTVPFYSVPSTQYFDFAVW